MTAIIVASPLSGWCLPLAQVPDPVFAQAMAGDGVAIDPTEGVLRAPFDGEIVPMRDAKHAVTVRHASGIEVLVHVGIDTVELRGAGFELVVASGQRVKAGDMLLRFDLDLLARRAPSLATPVVIASGGTVLRRAAGGRIASGDFLMEVAAISGTIAQGGDAREESRALVVPFDHGLHVRPAAQVAAALKPFAAEVRLAVHGREANARSPVAMMALGVRCGDELRAIARGTDAAAALDALETLFVRPAAKVVAAATPARPTVEVPARIEAIVASRGLALGPCVQARPAEIAVEERGKGIEQEARALEAALASVLAHLDAQRRQASGEAQALLAAHVELAGDPELRTRADAAVRSGASAGHAWRSAARATAEILAALDDERMRARAADLRDLEHQVLRVLAGEAPGAAREFPAGAIVVADEILPSQLLALERSQVAGIVTARGGATSHMAILAAAAELPALVAAGETVLAIPEGTRLALDAEHGVLELDPPQARAAALERTLAARRAERETDIARAREPAHTRDGVRITVNANLGAAGEAQVAMARGADGCGLLRTEFLFLDRRDAPGIEEQAREYQCIADALGGRPLAIRTMDIGGDKPIAYMPLAREENPALGERGVRAAALYPELLRAQLAAIVRVAPRGVARILLPMVTDIADLRFVRALLAEVLRESGGEAPALGAMIETPSAALLAPQLAEACEFLSIGTNDLAQYTLAIDRAHPRLAARLDAVHPAVLRLVEAVARAANERGKHAAVCGALASDIDALPLLIGLGIHEVSATAAAIPALKRVARAYDTLECRELARRALACATAAEVRELLAEARAARRSPARIAGG
jgi:phosphoenolpyruvate-protein phosphotransferase